ncbi:MAG: hypothetical protein Q9205_003007 [Flavoplaca limonia]
MLGKHEVDRSMEFTRDGWLKKVHLKMHLPFLTLLPFLLPLTLSFPLDERTTCSTSNTISDGNFESGNTPSAVTPNPWKTSIFLGSSTYSLTSPGSTLTTSSVSGGKYAFTASLNPGAYSSSGLTLSQTLRTCPGQNYSISADFRFSDNAENKCSITLVYPYGTQQGSVMTGSGIPGIAAGVWIQTGALFQAVTKSDVFKVVFACEEGKRNLIGFDRVLVKPYTGNVS